MRWEVGQLSDAAARTGSAARLLRRQRTARVFGPGMPRVAPHQLLPDARPMPIPEAGEVPRDLHRALVRGEEVEDEGVPHVAPARRDARAVDETEKVLHPGRDVRLAILRVGDGRALPVPEREALRCEGVDARTRRPEALRGERDEGDSAEVSEGAAAGAGRATEGIEVEIVERVAEALEERDPPREGHGALVVGEDAVRHGPRVLPEQRRDGLGIPAAHALGTVARKKRRNAAKAKAKKEIATSAAAIGKKNLPRVNSTESRR